MSTSERQKRAEARRTRAVLNKTHLNATEADLSPISGANAISLAVRLTIESWSLTGEPEPDYTRDRIPCRFVPGRLT
jgi:hypothetical protein